MHWIKKTIFAVAIAFLLFIFISFAGASLFSSSFLGLSGLILLLFMVVFEVNAVTYG